MRVISLATLMLAVVGCTGRTQVATTTATSRLPETVPPTSTPGLTTGCRWDPDAGGIPSVARDGWTEYGPIECTPTLPDPAPAPAWAPPSTFPPSVASAARDAIAAGLDVRELRYREVEIWRGTVWDHGGRARVFGFVRPAAVAGERPFVSVLGEWYAAVAVGPEVDLAEQCRSRLAGATPPPIARATDRCLTTIDRNADSLRDATYCPWLLSAIALEREHPELALRVATVLAEEIAANEQRFASAQRMDDQDPAAWLLFFGPLERALMAHMQGDDCLALQLLRGFEPLQDPPSDGTRRRDYGVRATLRALRTDQERRALASRSVVPEVPVDGPVAADLVPALIASLDEVDALQLSQPGGVHLGGEPQVSALLRAGAAAVPALIDAIERDTRLTRSVQFFRDFAPGREVISVREVAQDVLGAIVDTSFPIDAEVYRLESSASWQRFAAHLRVWWAQPAERSAAERSLAMLRDDGLDPAAWADAATWLRGTYYAWRAPGTRSPHRDPPGGGGPTAAVAAAQELGTLLMRRANDALRASAVPEACSLARTAWNADESVLAALVDFANACARAGACPCLDELTAALGPFRPALFDALDEYRPAEADHPLRVFTAAPEHPAVVRLAERVFARPPLAPSRAPAPPSAALAQRYLRRRLVGSVPGLSALVLGALRDRRVVGRVVIDDAASSQTTRDGVSWRSGHVITGDGSRYPVQLRHGQPGVEVRVCDLYADALDEPGTFWVDDEEGVRDAWIEALASSITRRPESGASSSAAR